MLARNSSLTHPSGTPLELPLLVPSFSSKGFALHDHNDATKDNSRQFSEIAYDLQMFGSTPNSSALISAYDLHFGHFEAPEMTSCNPLDHLQNVPIVILDSGGYELRSDYDSTEPKQHPHQWKDGFGELEYTALLAKLQLEDNCPDLIVTNFDHGLANTPLENQVISARRVLDHVSGHLKNFIVKPVSEEGSYIEHGHLDVGLFRNVDVVGFTEKELGNSLMRRLENICAIRTKMDDEKISAPIHVWGGLDPVLTPLYFFAGAEIFDGISWLRYAFINGVAIYKKCYSVLHPDCGITNEALLNKNLAQYHNLLFLKNLTNNLQLWVDHGGENFEMFDPAVADRLKKSYQIMKSKIPQLKGG